MFPINKRFKFPIFLSELKIKIDTLKKLTLKMYLKNNRTKKVFDLEFQSKFEYFIFDCEKMLNQDILIYGNVELKRDIINKDLKNKGGVYL